MNKGFDGPKPRLGRQGLGWGQRSFPGEMISGLVISDRKLSIARDEEADLRTRQVGGAGM